MKVGSSPVDYRVLLDRVHEMVTVSNREGRITYANAATERISGYPPEEFEKLDPFDNIHPEDRPRCERVMEKLVDKPGLKVELEHRIRHASGEWRWVSGTFESLFDDPSVGGLVATVRDVTDQREAREALSRSEEQFRLFVIASSEMVYRMSANWAEMRLMEGKHLLADTKDPSLTWTEEYIPEGDRELVRSAIDEAVRTKTMFELEHRILRVDGTIGWVFSRAIPLLDERGEVVEWFGAATDITERRRHREEVASLKDRETFMRAESLERRRISRELHDLVAHSLGVAHQSLELYEALMGTNPGRAAERLQLAREHILKSLQQTRNLSRELRYSVADEMSGGLEAAVRKLLDTTVPEDVEVEFSFAVGEEELTRDTGTQVYLIFREALNNILKHSNCEKLSVEFESRDSELRGSITDEGDGFDGESIAESAGVGLSSMRERARMVGGTLSIESIPGDGTAVIVQIPLTPEKPANAG